MNNTKNSNEHLGNSHYKNKNRNRKIIWFSPLFCKLTNINKSKYFLNLIDKHLPKNNTLSKIFNRSTLKISCSCTNYMSKNNHLLQLKITSKLK